MIGTLLTIIGILLLISVLYIGLEVGLYLKWAINRDPRQATDFETYADENESGLLARYCG